MAFPHVHHHLLPTAIHSTKEKDLPSSSNGAPLGACAEGVGEDFVLTWHMGVAYASGLSKNDSWELDAVVPVVNILLPMTVQGGLNAVPFIERGSCQVLMELLAPFKAVMDLGGEKAGV
ncbi:hypothetical protein B0H19DRAFT_1261281 [Mycena capillaripes]|nr:hypothetical protein B0H19DRAFT_1261281 [Mycena capillaripes]